MPILAPSGDTRGEAPPRPSWAWSGQAVDLIRDGVTPAQLRARGRRAVWGALLTTAESAQNRGMGSADWRALILERRSHLGTQLFHSQKGGKPRNPREVEKELAKAWEAAEAWLAGRPEAWKGAALEAEVASRVALARAVAEDPDAWLRAEERAVLLAIAAEHARRGMLRVTVPKRRLAELVAGQGVAEWAARKAVDSLATRGLIEVVNRGRPANPATGGVARAAMYALARPGLERLANQVEDEQRRIAILTEMIALGLLGDAQPVAQRAQPSPNHRPMGEVAQRTMGEGPLPPIGPRRGPKGVLAAAAAAGAGAPAAPALPQPRRVPGVAGAARRAGAAQ